MSGRNFSACKIRWTLRFNEFNIQIEHRPGCTNTVADCLSHVPRPEGEIDTKEQIRCSLLTSWIMQTKHQLSILSKIMEALEEPNTSAPEEFEV